MTNPQSYNETKDHSSAYQQACAAIDESIASEQAVSIRWTEGLEQLLSDECESVEGQTYSGVDIHRRSWCVKLVKPLKRHDTHSRYENIRLIWATIGACSWDDDEDNPDGIVTRYPDEASAQHDARRLEGQGFEVSVSRGEIGMPDESAGYLWVRIGSDAS